MRKALFAAPLLAAALATAPVAHADTDASFLSALDRHGIAYPTPSYAIRVAHGVCRGIDFTPGGTVYNAIVILTDDSRLPPADAAYFVTAAVVYYCPWDAGLPVGSAAQV
jgi:hypothetical protein